MDNNNKIKLSRLEVRRDGLYLTLEDSGEVLFKERGQDFSDYSVSRSNIHIDNSGIEEYKERRGELVY